MEYYLVLKRNELLSYEKIWKEFKFILLSKRILFKNIIYGGNLTLSFWKRYGYGNSVKIVVVQIKDLCGGGVMVVVICN